MHTLAALPAGMTLPSGRQCTASVGNTLRLARQDTIFFCRLHLYEKNLIKKIKIKCVQVVPFAPHPAGSGKYERVARVAQR
jgi:hypothetical protein